MAKKKATKAEAEDAVAPKSNRIKVIGMAVGFALIGAVVGPKVAGGSSAPPPAAADTTTTTVEGPVVVLDAVTLNLTDGHLLQVGLALELDPKAEPAVPTSDTDPTKGYAKAIDATIDLLGNESMASLSAPGGRTAAKTALEAELRTISDGGIVGVYFHQFVMQ
jgi:flagellar FliL protein